MQNFEQSRRVMQYEAQVRNLLIDSMREVFIDKTCAECGRLIEDRAYNLSGSWYHEECYNDESLSHCEHKNFHNLACDDCGADFS